MKWLLDVVEVQKTLKRWSEKHRLRLVTCSKPQ